MARYPPASNKMVEEKTKRPTMPCALAWHSLAGEWSLKPQTYSSGQITIIPKLVGGFNPLEKY